MFLANNLETRRFAKRIDYRIPQNATLIHFFITFIKYHNNNFKKLIAATCIMKYCTRPQYKCTLTRRMSQSQFVVRLVGRVSGWVLRPRLTPPKYAVTDFFFVRKRVPGASRGCPSWFYPPVVVVVHRWMGELSFRLVSFLTDFVWPDCSYKTITYKCYEHWKY